MNKSSVIHLFICIIAVAFAATIATLANTGAVETDWFRNLDKPAFYPPENTFTIVWSILYLLIALAGWLVWNRIHLIKPVVSLAMGYYFIQLGLNAFWSVIFFEFQSIIIAFLEIILLFFLVLLTTVKFYRIKPLAGWLFLPYLLWVGFAAVLNGAIVYLNW